MKSTPPAPTYGSGNFNLYSKNASRLQYTAFSYTLPVVEVQQDAVPQPVVFSPKRLSPQIVQNMQGDTKGKASVRWQLHVSVPCGELFDVVGAYHFLVTQ